MEKVMVPGSETLVGGWQELKATVALDAQRRNQMILAQVHKERMIEEKVRPQK